ncbi:MAG TPA: AI-2E family transporter [Gemmatimonadales bacterium]
MTAPGPRPRAGRSLKTMLLAGIFLILLTAALRLGAGMLLPIAIAGMLTLLLDSPVRGLQRLGLPTGVGAALVVFGMVGLMATGVGLLAGPATEWAEGAPKALAEAQARFRRILRPLQETARQVDKAAESAIQGGQPPAPTVQIKSPGVLQRLTGSTTRFLATSLTVVFLTYAQLAMLPVFRKKIAHLTGTRAGARNMEEVLADIERQMSRYMLINTLTSAGVGTATGAFLALVGLPNATLWGVAAFFLNFIPYAGAVVTLALVGLAAVTSFESTSLILLAMGGCAAINLLEGQVITPHLLGRHLPLNPVAIFVSLLYWGWVWGPAGALLAVPITVMLQVIAARIDRLHPLAVLLDS